MTNKEALKAWEKLYAEIDKESCLFVGTINPEMVSLAIKALEERTQGDWIPVNERLPDKNMPCLVSVGKLNFTQIAMYSDLMETIDHKIFYQGDYGKNNFQNITEYVNAWQPLPEPYKKEGEEE